MDAAISEEEKREMTDLYECPSCGRTCDKCAYQCGHGTGVKHGTMAVSAPLAALRYHVTGAIERGEAEAIVEKR